MSMTVTVYTLTAAEMAEYRRLVDAINAAANEYAADTRKLDAIGRSWDAADALAAFEQALRARLGADDLGYLDEREGEVRFIYRSLG